MVDGYAAFRERRLCYHGVRDNADIRYQTAQLHFFRSQPPKEVGKLQRTECGLFDHDIVRLDRL